MSEESMPGKSKMFQPDLADLVRLSREAVITLKLDGTITGWNNAAERMFGHSAGDVVGQSVSRIAPFDDLMRSTVILERIRLGETIEDLGIQGVRKDDRPIEVSLSLAPIRDDLRRTIGVLCLGFDVSVLNRLQRSERDQLFLTAIVSSAEDGIISQNLNGIVTSWNPGAERIFGYTAGEIIGRSITILVPPDHPNEEPYILEQIRRGQSIEHYETQRVRKDGRIIEVSLTVSPIKDQIGSLIGASKIVRDISDRKRIEKAERDQLFLASLVSSADDAIIGKDLHGIVTSWNAGAERIFGYTAEEMIGQSIQKLIPANLENEEPRILSRICSGERIEHYESERVRKDGQKINVSLTISPMRDRLGRIIGASKIVRDVTEKKEAEIKNRELLRQAHVARRDAEQARRQAEEASRAKDEFLAGISHELRTPMTAILGWNRMLLSGQLNAERQQKAFETIDRNARSQAQLIEDLLDVSRIISGKLRVELKPVDMIAVVNSGVEALRLSAEAKGVRIDTIFRSGAAPIVGDAERLQQVVWNLLSNAIKFTPRDGLVQLELLRADSQVELRVIDNGIGIRPEFLPHVFDRFAQADSSLTRSYKGLGMGLAIVKSLVELHGGAVSVSSPGEGQGAVFSVKLPVSAVAGEAVRLRPVERPALHSELKQRDDLVGLKILIVDDEPDTCEMLRFVFHECGSIVETALDANAALKVFDRWHPDMLISDIGMPDVDGYDLIRILRTERGSQLPAVALTAMARIDDRLKALAAGYQMHVAKPVEPVELVTIVASLAGLVNRPQER